MGGRGEADNRFTRRLTDIAALISTDAVKIDRLLRHAEVLSSSQACPVNLRRISASALCGCDPLCHKLLEDCASEPARDNHSACHQTAPESLFPP